MFPVTPSSRPVPAAETTEEPEAKTPRAKKAAKKIAKKAEEPALTDELKDRLTDLRKRGFNRLYQGGRIFEFSTPESLLEVDFALPVFVLVDRIVVSR